MPDNDRFAEIVKQLTQKTDEGLINWMEYDPGREEEVDPPDEAEQGYRTNHQGREVRVFRYNERHPTPEPLRVDPEAPDFTWDQKTVLKLKNPETEGEYTFPTMSITEDLYTSAQLQSAGVQEWMNRVLQDE